MRLFRILPFLCVTSILFAQSKIIIENPVIDIGSIYQGEIKTIAIPVCNAGTDTLFVKEVTTSCGCTVAKPSSFAIAPMGTATVEATFNSTGFQGQLTKMVSIQTNDTASPSVSVRMTFNVIAEIVPSDNLYNLWIGNVTIGKSIKKSFTFRNASDHPIAIAGGMSPSPEVAVHPVQATLKSEEMSTAEIEISPAKEGYTQSEFKIELTGTGQPALVMKITYYGLKAQ
jgi:hypothetical protein